MLGIRRPAAAGRGRGVTAWVLCAVTSAAAGALVAGVATTGEAPAEVAAPATTAGSVPVRLEPFDDARQVTLAVSTQQRPAPRSGASGVVTASRCSPGTWVASGDALVDVAGRPVVALATSTPLWRPLSVSTPGPDLDAVRAETARLAGRAVPLPPGEALSALAARLHVPVTDPLPVDHVAWLPERRVRATACPAAVGSTIGPDAPLLALGPALTRLALATRPADAVPGARALTVDGARLDVDDHGAVTSPAALATLSGSSALAAGGDDGAKAPPQGTWALRTPVQAARVPASSLVEAGERVCAVDESGRVVRVSVVSSVLGQSIVRFEGRPPARIVAAPAPGTSCA